MVYASKCLRSVSAYAWAGFVPQDVGVRPLGAASLPNIQPLEFVNSLIPVSTGFRHLVGCCGQLGQLGTGPPSMQGGRAHRWCSCWLASCPFGRSPCGRIDRGLLGYQPPEPCRANRTATERACYKGCAAQPGRVGQPCWRRAVNAPGLLARFVFSSEKQTTTATY